VKSDIERLRLPTFEKLQLANTNVPERSPLQRKPNTTMSNYQEPLFRYERHPGEALGRRLIASSDIRRDRLIFVERPVVAMQSMGNIHGGALVCSYCMAFCGSPQQTFRVISDPSCLEEVTTNKDNRSCTNEEDNAVKNNIGDDPHAMHCCMHNCGRIYCSLECQQDDWQWGGHKELCTGMIPDADEPDSDQNVLEPGTNTIIGTEDENQNGSLPVTDSEDEALQNLDPLLQFKIHATNTNEIFLLVATWLVRILKHNLPYHEDDNRNTHPLTDFQMNTWWDVKAKEEAQIGGKEEKSDGSKEEENDVQTESLEDVLKQLCEESHSHLSQTLLKSEPHFKDSPWLTPVGMARLIGSLEQNCLGIRRKHAIQRNIMLDTDLRHEFHDELIRCLEEAGMIGEGDEICDDDSCSCDEGDGDDDTSARTIPTSATDANVVNNTNADFRANEGANSVGKSDPSPDDVATFLATLTQDLTNGCVLDEWDEVIRPLDGVSHYSIATKMNHSCDPNVTLVYKTRGWGRDHPLVAYVVALKDITEGEELTISYIDSQDPYEERQAALANYGFVCTCSKCKHEKDVLLGAESVVKADSSSFTDDDLFGEDNDDDEEANLSGEDDDSEEQTDHDADNNPDDEENENNDKQGVGEERLLDFAERLDAALNDSKHATIPLAYLAPASNYVIKQATSLLVDMKKSDELMDDDQIVENLLQKIKNAVRNRDFSACRTIGSDLELHLYKLLEVNGSWTTSIHRASYWCAGITASIGFAHEGSFLVAMKYLDKATILGQDRGIIEGYFGYVELYASQMAAAPCPIAVDCKVSDYRRPELKELVTNSTLTKAIQFPVKEFNSEKKYDKANIMDSYNQSQSCVIRGLASEWEAVENWRNMDALAWEFGHRLVPIEIGSMTAGMKEAVVTFRRFVAKYMSASALKDCWTLEDATAFQTNKIAYLAQHPLLDQVPALSKFIEMNPCKVEPTNINIWMGTGGTRTPLHFDSYDNLLVQLVGAKYVRLYEKENTPQLYVRKDKSYGGQGNMSELDCEQEDYERHPLAKACSYEEVLLFPGDCLFIPSRQWHYVRSLSTSVSVNYWF